MFDAEFTHEGNRCTFEVLLRRAGLTDTALHAIGEVIHDIDLRDDKFKRSGIARMTSDYGGHASFSMRSTKWSAG